MSSIPVKTSKNFSFCFIFLNIFPGDRTTTTSVILWSYTVWMLNNSQKIQQKNSSSKCIRKKVRNRTKHVNIFMDMETHGNTYTRKYWRTGICTQGHTCARAYVHTNTYVPICSHTYIDIYILLYDIHNYIHGLRTWKRMEIRTHGNTCARAYYHT